MKDKKVKQYCEHNFKYAHQEQDPIAATTSYTLVDVVVCTKCGLVRRN